VAQTGNYHMAVTTKDKRDQTLFIHPVSMLEEVLKKGKENNK
jgi:hypothetical protein